MSEPVKTITFIVIALLCAVGVFWNLPTLAELQEGDPTGQLLFPKFTDPLAPTSLSITKYNKKTSDLITFEVAKIDGTWQIPSHDNYPADAADHFADAATVFSGLKILGLASDELGSQEAYEVVDPTDKDLKHGATGVGMRVVMKDAKGKSLVDLIIGAQDLKRPNIRYVRRTDQEMIFSVDMKGVKPDTLTTKFNAWIKKDLLKMNVLDIQDVFIEDYYIDEIQGDFVQQGKLVVRYDPSSEKGKWKLLEDLLHDSNTNKWVSKPLEPHEMLDIERLQQMKTALKDLKIIDVLRKPTGLSANLAAEKSLRNNLAAIQSLKIHGFHMATIDGQYGIYSNEGEIGVLLSDGVEYVLRFGNIAVNTTANDDDDTDKNKDGSSKDKDTDASGVNRYLIVTARFNPTAIPRPNLQTLPELPKEKPNENAPAVNLEEIKEKRTQIERENQWKQDEYDEKIATGKKQVEQLNARFADWYYIISESVFKKLHLTRKELIKVRQLDPIDTRIPPSKPDPMSPFSPSTFQKLKKGIDTP